MGLREIIFRKKYHIGQGVVLSGGYDPVREPKWLHGQESRHAHIAKIIPGQNKDPALVVEFDKPFEVDGYSARFAVLELRYEGAKWRSGETCHIEICDFIPEDKPWKDRKQGKWIESHATFTLETKKRI